MRAKLETESLAKSAAPRRGPGSCSLGTNTTREAGLKKWGGPGASTLGSRGTHPSQTTLSSIWRQAPRLTGSTIWTNQVWESHPERPRCRYRPTTIHSTSSVRSRKTAAMWSTGARHSLGGPNPHMCATRTCFYTLNPDYSHSAQNPASYVSSFTRRREPLRLIPATTYVLVTHSPPNGKRDFNDIEHSGCELLLQRVLEVCDGKRH